MCSENHLHFDYVRLAWDSGFSFEESKAKATFDYNHLGLVDVERVIRERDIATVEKHIPTILQFQLDDELAKILDPTFVKVFRLCQFSIQYLKFCKIYLDKTVIILKKDLNTVNEENEDYQKLIDELRAANEVLQQRNNDLRETFQCHLTNHGVESNPNVSYKCDECPKVFLNEEYLTAHIKRRHDPQNEQLQKEAEKLQLEIKELKERLNKTEKFIQVEKHEIETEEKKSKETTDEKNETEIQLKFEQLKEHIEKELGSLRDESFYRNIYEKWFEEMYTKLHNNKTKTYTERGSGDYVQIKESYTQTNLAEDTQGMFEGMNETPKPTPRSEIPKIKELEQKFKKEAETQREHLENILEEKLTGSLGKLESQISTFWQKLNALEANKLEIRPPPIAYTVQKMQTANDIQSSIDTSKILAIKPKQSPKIVPRVIPTRYISSGCNAQTIANSTESDETDDSDEKSEQKLSPKHHIAKKTIQIDTLHPIKVLKAPLRVKSREKIDNVIASRIKSKIKLVRESQKIQTREDTSDSDPKEIKVLKSYSGKDTNSSESSETVTEESESELDTETKSESIKRAIEVQPSNTSTLAQRSLTSLKKASLDKDLNVGLKHELQEVLNSRLKELGVAPHWKGLPKKTFQHVFGVVQHQASLTQKTTQNFLRIRDEISKNVDKEIREQHAKSDKNGKKLQSTPTRLTIETIHPPKRLGHDTKRLGMQQETPKRLAASHETPKRLAQSSETTKRLEPQQEIHSTPLRCSAPIQTIPTLPLLPSPKQRTFSAHPVPSPRRSFNQPSQSPQRLVQQSLQITKPAQTKFKEIKEIQTFSDSSSVSNGSKTVKLHETPNKGVLKTHQPGTDWSNKKRVLFNLESDASNEIEVMKDGKIEVIVGGSTSSLPSSILDGPKANKENVKVKDDSSDFDISD